MENFPLHELLRFLQQKPAIYRTPIVFGVDDPKIKEDILSVLSDYRRKIFFINPYLEEQTSSEGITLQKSQQARLSFPVLSVGIVETSGLNFNQHSPNTAGWPGSSTAQVIRNFPGKLHLLAELHGTKEVYYYCGFAIRWGRESYQVIYIESVTKGTLIAPIDSAPIGEDSKDTEELIALQFVPDGQEKTLGQMTPTEKQIHDPRLKALGEVLRELENNGLHRE
jgi:inosine/xanthosine triphosphate pyrophosphatase family protein